MAIFAFFPSPGEDDSASLYTGSAPPARKYSLYTKDFLYTKDSLFTQDSLCPLTGQDKEVMTGILHCESCAGSGVCLLPLSGKGRFGLRVEGFLRASFSYEQGTPVGGGVCVLPFKWGGRFGCRRRLQ